MIPDPVEHAVIQHFVVHEGEVGDIVWPLPDARLAVGLWLRAAGDAAHSVHLTAREAQAADWRVFDIDPSDGRPVFVVVDGLSLTAAELDGAITTATVGVAQPVLLFQDGLDEPVASRLEDAGWRLTDARKLLTATPGQQRSP